MSVRLSDLVCGVLLLGTVLPTLGAPSFSVIVSDVGGQDKEKAPVVPAVFGNREEKITLTIASTDNGPGYLRGDLYQIAGTLSMPIAKDIHLKDGIIFRNALAQNLDFSLKLPDVKQPTKIFVQVSVVTNDPQAVPIHLTDFAYNVFPASVTRELTGLLQPDSTGSTSVIIFGPGQKLRHFFSNLHVPFEDAGAGTPDRFDPARLYFGELTSDEQFQQAQDQSAGARMALFSPDESLPSGYYAERSSSGVLIHVTLPLPDNLNDDPRAQLALIKIIHLLSAPAPSSN